MGELEDSEDSSTARTDAEPCRHGEHEDTHSVSVLRCSLTEFLCEGAHDVLSTQSLRSVANS